jgi:hypothetical protein
MIKITEAPTIAGLSKRTQLSFVDCQLGTIIEPIRSMVILVSLDRQGADGASLVPDAAVNRMEIHGMASCPMPVTINTKPINARLASTISKQK